MSNFSFRLLLLTFFSCAMIDPCHAKTIHNGEVSLTVGNLLIYSQEYMKYFFSNDDSRVRPLPAQSMLFGVSRAVGERFNLGVSFSLPTSNEQVARRGEDTFIYHYAKIVVPLLEYRLWHTEYIDILLGVGANIALSSEFIRYSPLSISNRLIAHLDSKLSFTAGAGYSGLLSRGAFFLLFGFSYTFERSGIP